MGSLLSREDPLPWRKQWQPTPVFSPEKSHGQRSLVGYSPWGHKEPDTTERVSTKHRSAQNQVEILTELVCLCG